MKPVSLVLLAIGLMLFGAASADDETALAKAKYCMNCHKVERKLIGPSYKDVAKRYAGQEGVAAKLAEKIIKGSKGAWEKELGVPMPMPPNTSVKPEEAARLVEWILGLK